MTLSNGSVQAPALHRHGISTFHKRQSYVKWLSVAYPPPFRACLAAAGSKILRRGVKEVVKALRKGEKG